MSYAAGAAVLAIGAVAAYKVWQRWWHRTRLPSSSSATFQEYLEAFGPDVAREPFLSYYGVNADKSVSERQFSRGEFWDLARRAAAVLVEHGLDLDECQTHYFSGNTPHDLAFRLGALMVGTVPVTVNWQADTLERVVHKVRVTGSRLLLVDSETPKAVIDQVLAVLPSVRVFNVADIERPEAPLLPLSRLRVAVTMESPRFVIFTSGTTGKPKGVALPHRAYAVNKRTFEGFLGVDTQKQLVAVVVNPLHHTNSTAICDWAMRRPKAKLHLVQRYSTQYWAILARAGTGLSLASSHGELSARLSWREAQPLVIVAPLVSRHFDFLEALHGSGDLPTEAALLRRALSGTFLLLGSAPVGPTTVERLQRFAGRLPVVRFGSTETCLQVMGTPLSLSEAERLRAFEAGWAHRFNAQPQSGYYIGRPHPPHTEVKVVRSVKRTDAGYMVECLKGEPGQLITRGGNLMSGYVGDVQASASAFDEGGWYTKLGDIAFWLNSEADGERDFFWLSRDSALLIRGGANYAYEQINAELLTFLSNTYGLDPAGLAVAVVGLRLSSEHEDECCVTVELNSAEALSRKKEIEASFLAAAKRAPHISKGSKPDRLRIATLPRNFKGAVQLPELKAAWAER